MQIIFTANKKMFSRLIRYFTHHSWLHAAEVSHAALRFKEPEQRWMVESSIHGFAPNFWPKFKNVQVVYERFNTIGLNDKVLEQVIEEFIEKNLYRPYGYLEIVGFAIAVGVYWITGKQIKNPLAKENRGFSCAEVVYRIFDEYSKRSGQEVFDEFDPELVFPQDILNQCRIKNNLFQKIES